MNYTVSVIIPVYNCEKYLERAIESVINQTVFNTVQLILVDDGSRDRSPEICDDYSRRYDNIICIHQKNSGVSVARNSGMERAEGEWISFLDSDDYFLDTFLEKMLARPADLICCPYTGNGTQCTLADKLEERIYNSDELEHLLYPVMADGSKFFSCWNKLYKLSIIRSNNLTFPVGVKLAEDMTFVYNYVKCIESFSFVSEPLYYYFVNQANTTNVVAKGYETYKMIYIFLSDYFRNCENEELLKIVERNYVMRAVDSVYTAANELNIFSAVRYIKKILCDSLFFESYKELRICKCDEGMFSYLDKFIMKKFSLLIFVLVRYNEHRSKRLANKNEVS